MPPAPLFKPAIPIARHVREQSSAVVFGWRVDLVFGLRTLVVMKLSGF